MTEHPILFSGPMVRAIMDERKTVTRRIVKLDDGRRIRRSHRRWHPADPNAVLGCPYGQAGDTLWVRETFSGPRCMGPVDGSAAIPPSRWPPGISIWYWADGNPEQDDWTRPKPSIHMPRWASRITLRVTDVRVERLQDISHLDSVAEGLTPISKDGGRTWKYGIPDRDGMPGTDDCGWPWHQFERSPRDAFRRLWDGLNDKRGVGWDTNPWVWVISFERVEPAQLQNRP